jgi:hypothetical protein
MLSHDVQKEALNQILSLMDEVNVSDSCGQWLLAIESCLGDHYEYKK